MASKSFEGNFKAWLLETEPTSWDPDSGSVIGATELTAGTRLLRLVSDGAVTYSYTENTASQALVDKGKVSHNIGTREVTGGMITHEIDHPLESDAMYSLYNYGDARWLIVCPNCPNDEPDDGAQLYGFEVEMGEPNPLAAARDTKQNFQVSFAAQDWDFKATFDASA